MFPSQYVQGAAVFCKLICGDGFLHDGGLFSSDVCIVSLD